MVSFKQLLIGGIATATALTVGYLVYFDQKRQKDPEFRKKLKKQRKARKSAEKETTESAPETASSPLSASSALKKAKAMTLPTKKEEQEAFFYHLLTDGEVQFKKGPEAFEDSAVSFFMALSMYPEPMELLTILQQRTPTQVFELVMEMLVLDIKNSQKEYFEYFPTPDKNVKIEEFENGLNAEGKPRTRRALILNNEFAEKLTVGEEVQVYQEDPILSTLEPNIDPAAFCGYCLCSITDSDAVINDAAFSHETYCSEGCHEKATKEYIKTLTQCPEATESLYSYCKANNVHVPILIAKLLALLVAEKESEGERLAAAQASGDKKKEFSIYDHIERMQYLDLDVTPLENIEHELVSKALAKAEGLSAFLTLERFVILKGKFLYNCIAIPTDDESLKMTSEQARSSTPLRVGTGLYQTSSYIYHSCKPNTRLQLTGRKCAVMYTPEEEDREHKGELMMSWIPMSITDVEERKKLLKEGWRMNLDGTIANKTAQGQEQEQVEEKVEEEVEEGELVKPAANMDNDAPREKDEDEKTVVEGGEEETNAVEAKVVQDIIEEVIENVAVSAE